MSSLSPMRVPLLVLALFSALSLHAAPLDPILLWPNGAPGALGEKDDDKPTPRPYDSVMNSSRPLTPAELGIGGRAAPAPGAPEQSSPSQLGEKKSNFLSFDWLKKEEYGTFTGEPPRVSLTDPPLGYQTPSPDQPYGITPEQKTYKPPSLGERMEPSSGTAASPGH